MQADVRFEAPGYLDYPKEDPHSLKKIFNLLNDVQRVTKVNTCFNKLQQFNITLLNFWAFKDAATLPALTVPKVHVQA